MNPESSMSIVRSHLPEDQHAPFSIIDSTGRTICSGLQSETECERVIICVQEVAQQIATVTTVTDGNGKTFTARKFVSRPFVKAQRGSVLLELALAMPLILLIVIGGIDLHLLANCRSIVNYTSEECAIALQKSPQTNAQGCAASLVQGLGLNPASVTASGSAAALTVSYAWTPISPFFKSAMVSATASAN